MKRGSKIVIILSAALVALGIACISIGVAKGGLHNMSIAGSHLADPDDVKTEKSEVSHFKSIDAYLTYFDVNIQRGDTYSVEVRYLDSKPDIEVSGDTLKIKDDKEDHKSIIVGAGGEDDSVGAESWTPELTITVPEEKLLETVSIKNVMGDTNIINMMIKDFKADIVSGDIDLSGSTLQTVSVNDEAGDVEGTGVIISNNVKIDISTGDVSLQGRLLGKAAISSKTGDVELDLNNPETDYSYEMKANAGDLEINGNEYGGAQNRSGGKNTLKINTAAGDIEVNFDKAGQR